MSTLIFGAGAIGQWLGALLHSCGTEVQLHGRPRVAASIEKLGGIILNDAAPLRVPFSATLEELQGKKFDTVISTVKTYAVEQALKELKSSGVEFQKLVSFQNGWGTDDLYRELFPDKELWAITTTRAVGIEEPGKLTPSNKGGLALAPWDKDTAGDVPEGFRRVSIPLVMIDSALNLKWSKLLLNLIGNATGAITGLSPQKLANNAQLMKAELALVRECIAVGKAMGVRRVDLPGFPVKILSGALDKLPLKLVEPLISSRMRKARGDKLPSLFFDLEEPSRPTEIDELNGAVAAEGKRFNVATPKHSALLDLFHLCRKDQELWGKIREKPELLLDYV